MTQDQIKKLKSSNFISYFIKSDSAIMSVYFDGVNSEIKLSMPTKTDPIEYSTATSVYIGNEIPQTIDALINDPFNLDYIIMSSTKSRRGQKRAR